METIHFIQVAPWLGLSPGNDGQVEPTQEVIDSPIISLFKSATSSIVSNPQYSGRSFSFASKQAEAAGM